MNSALGGEAVREVTRTVSTRPISPAETAALMPAYPVSNRRLKAVAATKPARRAEATICRAAFRSEASGFSQRNGTPATIQAAATSPCEAVEDAMIAPSRLCPMASSTDWTANEPNSAARDSAASGTLSQMTASRASGCAVTLCA